jgi:hypothetical protein
MVNFIGKVALILALIVIALLLTACSKDVDSETVAYDFVRLYFVEDNMAEAVKLASGSAKTKLEGFLREIEATGAKEPAKDRPLVKATMLETQPVSQDEMQYIYRVTADVEVEGMEPITAKLWLSKEGNAWRVSKFVQQE